MKSLISFLIVTGFFLLSCHSYKRMPPTPPDTAGPDRQSIIELPPKENSPQHAYVKVLKNVSVKRYFHFMDSLVGRIDTAKHYRINEYILVHANPWILDSLRGTDYYAKKEKGKFQRDQTSEIILHRGDSLIIPDSTMSNSFNKRLLSTVIDLNIPEFKLRLIQLGDTILSCRVRVGRNAIQYLELAKRDVLLRTPVGSGKIVRIARIPYQVNPETAERYLGTHRDDGRFTEMPIIPWLEPEIGGIRYGTMIHPTTNPNTLGKAVSHGCVGTSEVDAWTIYYNCPVGTKVVFRYDLRVINDAGDTLRLRDIYKAKPKRLETTPAASLMADKSHFSFCF